MGFADGSFSYTGLIQGLPFSYGRFVATQLVATALRINLGVPSVRHDNARAQPELAEVGREKAMGLRLGVPRSLDRRRL
eukprot:2815014-Pleurochrysis_carterae.AAC.1